MNSCVLALCLRNSEVQSKGMFQLTFLCSYDIYVCVCVCVCVCTLCDPMEPARFLCPWIFPGRNTSDGCHFLLQGNFWTQGSNPCLLHLLHWHVGLFTTAATWEAGREEAFCLFLYFHFTLEPNS